MKTFELHIKELICGCCDIEATINGTLIQFYASYLGDEPLATLIDACANISYRDPNGSYFFSWISEPGLLEFEMALDSNDLLKINILKYSAEIKTDEFLVQELHEELPFPDFRSEVVREAWKVLCDYGLRGYSNSWSDHAEFPLTSLLRIMMDRNPYHEPHSDLSQEVKTLFSGLLYPMVR